MPKRTCECGECRKCKHRERMRAYYAENAERVREIVKASRERRIEAVRAYDRKRGHRVYSREAENARGLVQKRISRGRWERQPCEVCGQPNAEAHHEDYSKPLDVRWLCRAHHMELHRRIA